jgi:malonyl-CoA O-methyltransferase
VKLPDRYGLPQQAAVRLGFDRAAARFDAAAGVHAEARQRLLERLALFALEPACILDVGAATGRGSAALAAHYPDAEVIAVDTSLAMLRHAQANNRVSGNIATVAGDAHELPVRDYSVDLIFANLLLPWCEPDRVFAEFARVLREGGLALFTTCGPDTLIELRRAWSGVDQAIHVHGFIDMHDLGDLAARAGLTEPVMDVDRLEISYANLDALIAELRATGAGNAAVGRPQGLTGRGRWHVFAAAMATATGGARVPVTVELVFGQAFGAGRPRGSRDSGDGVVRIAAAELSRSLKKGPPKAS